MARRYRRRSTGGPKRQAVWFDTIVDFTLAGNGTTLVSLDSNIIQAVKKGLTVVRTIIDLTVQPQGTGTGGTLSAGIAMYHGDAVAAGATPDPEDPNEQGGYLWRWAGSAYVSVLNDRSQATKLVYDIKAKRKFPSEDHELIFIFNQDVGAFTHNVDGLIRVLCLKP